MWWLLLELDGELLLALATAVICAATVFVMAAVVYLVLWWVVEAYYE